jgi:DNA polymerase (family 10)
MEAIFQAARQYGKALEISAMPTRLDLKDSHINLARQMGIKLVISTDAHRRDQMSFMHFGVGTARRGWSEAKDILNAKPLETVLEFLGLPPGIAGA